MRKRSKKRISQELVPWVRAFKYVPAEDSLNILNKRTTRWSSGYNRYLQTRLFNEQLKSFWKNFIIRVFKKAAGVRNEKQNKRFQMRWHFILKALSLSVQNSKSKLKSFCLLLGKGSSYNSKLFISRQSFRKLLRYNALIGIKKT